MRLLIPLALLAATLSACAPSHGETAPPADLPTGTPVAVVESVVTALLDAPGMTAPIVEATLSTRLMATVTDVLVREGDRVATGQVLLRLDARDLDARQAQVEAAIAGATAAHQEAERHARRLRALWNDSAAPRAQVDAAEAALARADAGVRAAQAGAAELAALRTYAELRAPFAGTVVRRFVDPGALAAPGAPLLALEDGSRLRLTATAAPAAVRSLTRGTRVPARIEDAPATATVEGVVPAPGGATWEVNATIENRDARYLTRSAAALRLPAGERSVLLVPAAALRREADLVGVIARRGGRADLRWIRIGESYGDRVEVLAGLVAGDTVFVPAEPGR